MPVGVEQWRAAVGVMANSVAAKPQSPIGLHWKKWLKTSDPVVYKGCVVFLVVVAQLVWSGLEQYKKTKEGSSERLCQSASRGKNRVGTRPCERHGMDSVWTGWLDSRQIGLMIILSPLTQLTLSIKRHCHLKSHPNVTTLKEWTKSLSVHVHLVLLSVHMFLSLLKRCLHCSTSLVCMKCSMKTVAEGVVSLMSLLFSTSVRTGLRVVTMIVFVNQMLLMRAGDVERNPGPDELGPDDLRSVRGEIFSVRNKWYDIGLELNIPYHTLNVIEKDCPNNCADCLRKMLENWLTRTYPGPSWSGLVDALSSEPVGEKRLARHLHSKYYTTRDGPEDRALADTCDATRKTDHLTFEMEELQKQFLKLRDDVYESVKTQPVDTFRVKLTSLDVNAHMHHETALQAIIGSKETIEGIWIALSSYMNFLNYELLQHVLDKLEIEAHQERMQRYTTKITSFFVNTLVCDFIKYRPVSEAAPPESALRHIIVKCHKDWETCTLYDLDQLKGRLARKLLVPNYILNLQDIQKSSVSVIFSIPTSMVALLQADIKDTELTVFADMDIETITVDSVVCYEAPLLQYTTHLKQLYTSRSPLQPLTDSKPKHLLQFRLARIEKQTLSQGDMDRFTRESLRGDMDDVVYKKTAMELSELGVMPDSSQPKVVLIEGAPGVGKTTFAWDQCRQWAEGKLLHDYNIVLLLPLRDKNIRQITSLPSLFRHSNGQIGDEVTRTVLKNEGRGCLIWLEGWDELVDDLRSDSLFTQLIRGIQLPTVTIYITSRPWATGGLLELMEDRLSQHIEVLALAKKEVENQISTLAMTAPGYISYIESNPILRAAMYTPVTAAIAEQVFKSALHNLPTTVTQLYSAYVLMRLEQYLTEHPKYSDMKIKVRTLADLPEEVLADFQRLCGLAYEGVSQQMIVFSSLPEGVSTLGLLQSVPQVYDEGENQVSYNFLHYTVQEYLAALHLSRLQPQEQMTIINTKFMGLVRTKWGGTCYDVMQMKTIFQFLAGITQLKSFPVRFLLKLLSKDAATVYSWLYESQNLPLLIGILDSDEKELNLPYSATTTDCFVAGYCLAHSKCTWSVRFSSFDDLTMEFLSKGYNHQLLKTGISSRIIAASLSWESTIADGVAAFLTFPNSLLQHIQHLNLSGNKLDRRACDLLALGVKRMSCLEKLNLSLNSDIGCGGTVQLVLSLHGSKLIELNMYSTGISDPDFECLASYIHSTTSLRKLSIGWNDISVESIASLCTALSDNSSMRSLDMSYCHLISSHCVCLGQLLRHPIHCKIEDLDLNSCSLTSDGVREVVSGLSDNHTLRVLNLNDNQITSEGVAAVKTILKKKCSLERLYLAWCGIDSSGGVELGEALERNKTLRELVLSRNALGDDGVRGLCVGLENNTSLEELNLSADELLGDEGVSLLLKWKHKKLRVHLPERFQRTTHSMSGYQGLDVIAKKTVKVINKEQHVVWDGYGLRLHIPSNSLPDDLSQFTLRIEVVQTGNFELPDGDGILVSAIYSFSHDLGDRKVCHPVTVEMQHCAPTTALNNLRIVRADEKSVQPWKLQFMTVDISNCSDGYGAFKMHHFCSIAIYFRLHVASLFWTLKPYAKLYFMNIKRRSFDFNLYILPCLDALLKEIDTDVKRKDYNFKHGPNVIFSFDENVSAFSLRTPEIISGWKMKQLVENHEMDVREIFRPLFGPIPFQVEVTWNEDIETPGQLHYVTDIVGAQNCRLCVTSPTVHLEGTLSQQQRNTPAGNRASMCMWWTFFLGVSLAILVNVLLRAYQGFLPATPTSVDPVAKEFSGHTYSPTEETPIWMNQEPTLQLLSLIQCPNPDGSTTSFYLIREIQNRCIVLGTRLGIDEPTLQSLRERNVHHGLERLCTEILNEWIIRGEGNYNVTWAGLLQALQDVPLKGIAKRLKEALTLYFKANT